MRFSYLLMCLGMCGFHIPPFFFYFGAFHSGMPFYCLASILICSLYRKFWGRLVLTIAAVAVDRFIFYLAWMHPDLATKIDDVDAIQDVIVSFIVMSGLIFVIVTYLLKAYYRERSLKDALIQKLDYSSHDPLTGLFNRRHFIDFLTGTVLANRQNYYLLMYDIDFFKRINDAYGHLFGDQVLCAIGKVAAETCKEDGELAVRYGGEEFILVMRAENLESAFSKAEDF